MFGRTKNRPTTTVELPSVAGVVRFVGFSEARAIVPASFAAGASGVSVHQIASQAARYPTSLIHRPVELLAPAARALLAMPGLASLEISASGADYPHVAHPGAAAGGLS
jgi:hypothetical protein